MLRLRAALPPRLLTYLPDRLPITRLELRCRYWNVAPSTLRISQTPTTSARRPTDLPAYAPTYLPTNRPTRLPYLRRCQLLHASTRRPTSPSTRFRYAPPANLAALLPSSTMQTETSGKSWSLSSGVSTVIPNRSAT